MSFKKGPENGFHPHIPENLQPEVDKNITEPKGRLGILKKAFDRTLDYTAIAAYVVGGVAATFFIGGTGYHLFVESIGKTANPDLINKIALPSLAVLGVTSALVLAYRAYKGNFGVLRD